MIRFSSLKARKLEQVAKEIANCRICKKGKVGKPVPGEGDPNADLIFLGEAPGKEEAKTGRPFIGRAGKVLRKLITDSGLKEQDVYITSPVKYLPKYVTPTKADIEHGKIHLLKQIDIIQPKLIVLLGNTAALAMLARKISFSKEHGTIVEDKDRKYFLTYHPAAMLHNPRVAPTLKVDFKKLKKFLSRGKK